jgi:hypothetical protein
VMFEIRDGIPRVEKVNLEVHTVGIDGWVEVQQWQVTHPDRWEWDCCGLTDWRLFMTWDEAVTFALRRDWERE